MFCFFCHLSAFYDFKIIKSIKIEQNLLKMINFMTPKTTDQNIWFLNERIRFNLLCKFTEGGIKLQILINNYLWRNLVTTRHLRPCLAKRKMSVDDSSQKIGRNMHLQGTVMHQFSIGKCIEQHNILEKSPPYRKTTLSSLCFLTCLNNVMFFLWDEH